MDQMWRLNVVPQSDDDWICFLEALLGSQFTMVEAKKWAVKYFGKRAGKSTDELRSVVSKALKTHRRVTGLRGTYHVAKV